MESEDYPGQQRESELEVAIKKAIETADRIILDASDGSVEETDYLTARVALAFVSRVQSAITSKYLAKMLRDREPKPPKIRDNNT